MSEDMLLELRGVSKEYGEFALEGISFSVPGGSIVGLIGANGAGKTTTIKAILGAIRPNKGSIRLFGEEVAPCDSAFVGAKRCARLRQGVGFVPDSCAFPLEYEVASVGALCARVFEKWDAARFARLCKEFGLSAGKKVDELSRGMGMKLSLAVALSHGPRLLVLDEATAGLDPLAREEIVGLLRKVVADEGCGILMSSHITSDLERAADEIVCINEGRVLFDCEIDEICDRAGIAHCRAAELDFLLDSRVYELGALRIRRGGYSSEVLVPNRFEFAEAFPEIAIERATIDSYLSLYMKGEKR